MGIVNQFLFAGTRWFRWIFPSGWWRFYPTTPTLYLTFDDGPIPKATPFVLDVLQQYQAKATFFVIGDNARKHPEILQRILEQGHAIGNHTMHHVNGLKTPSQAYWKEVLDCQNIHHNMRPWFRPPYGRISRKQYQIIRKTHDIVFWDVITQDYDEAITPEACLSGTLKAIRSGSIVVFHDSIKAWPRLSFVLPRLLEEASRQGYRFEILPIPPRHSTNKST